MDYTYDHIARMIDHSLLHPRLDIAHLQAGCHLAVEYQCASVSVMPYFTRQTAEILRGSTVITGTTIAFPHGLNATATKVAETRQAILDGVEELDMVSNVSLVLSEEWAMVRDDLQAVIEVAHDAGVIVKVIFENCYLDDARKIALCEICSEIPADFVKTSTGFGSGGATLEDIQLMRAHAAPHVMVKAAGGVRDLDSLLTLHAAGATRFGATQTKPILDAVRERLAAKV